jgi:alanine dehydrogenase
MSEPLWISEAEVVELLDIGEAIAALEAGLAQEAAGAAQNMVKTHAIWGAGHTLHAIGAVFPDTVGTKTWAHTEGGATPLLILFDAHDGRLLAVIEAFALGQLRTGGISGLATKLLARPEASVMALIGTGKQSLTQLAAVAAVRRLKEVRVFSPTAAKRRAFLDKARLMLDLDLREAGSVAAACEGAEIVTLVTRAREPFLDAAMVAAGSHINAVGAITPERMEFAPDLLDRCAVIAGDSVEQVRRLSRELEERFGEDETQWRRVVPLSSRLGASRPAGADLTIFKAMGMGISDLSLGREILRRALDQGRGHPFPHPETAQPRLRPSLPSVKER